MSRPTLDTIGNNNNRRLLYMRKYKTWNEISLYDALDFEEINLEY